MARKSARSRKVITAITADLSKKEDAIRLEVTCTIPGLRSLGEADEHLRNIIPHLAVLDEQGYEVILHLPVDGRDIKCVVRAAQAEGA